MERAIGKNMREVGKFLLRSELVKLSLKSKSIIVFEKFLIKCNVGYTVYHTQASYFKNDFERKVDGP